MYKTTFYGVHHALSI